MSGQAEAPGGGAGRTQDEGGDAGDAAASERRDVSGRAGIAEDPARQGEAPAGDAGAAAGAAAPGAPGKASLSTDTEAAPSAIDVAPQGAAGPVAEVPWHAVAPEAGTEPAAGTDGAGPPDGGACVLADDATGMAHDAMAADVVDAPDPALLAEGARIAEALIFASDRPVTPAMLGAVLPAGLAPGAVVAALADACEGRGVMIAEVAGGWAFRTAPDLAQRLTKVVQAPRRLPRAAMEALSIIAYHQPCTRGEIEEIRGAALAQTTLEALLELSLVAPRGRREVPGRPTLWGTTPKFLEQFGLKALGDLPRKEELVTAETGPALPLGGPPGAPEAAADALPEAEPAPEPSTGHTSPGAAP
jgi:segregation and condensation protein B